MAKPASGPEAAWSRSTQYAFGGVRQDLTTQNDIVVMGIFRPMVAHAADAWDEEHCCPHFPSEQLCVMAGTAGHSHVPAGRVPLGCRFQGQLEIRIHGTRPSGRDTLHVNRAP
jgi:hypothetical protein